jgi:hypothetical protein
LEVGKRVGLGVLGKERGGVSGGAPEEGPKACLAHA